MGAFSVHEDSLHARIGGTAYVVGDAVSDMQDIGSR